MAVRALVALGLFLLVGSLNGCLSEETFPPIGQRIAGPSDVAVSKDGRHFYVLNTDFDRRYQSGSLLVLKEDGTKVAAIETPRMGRSLNLAANRLLVTFDADEEGKSAGVQLFDLSDPEAPKHTQTWVLPCAPLNGVQREGYDHFAVSCMNGDLYMGTFSNAQLTKVRNAGSPRRALYIDPERELLLAFPTTLGFQDSTYDLKALDEKTFNDKGEESAQSNEIPDDYESDRRRRGIYLKRTTYNVIVYDIAAERAAGFPERALFDSKDPTAMRELRWLYFTLTNFDGTPDSDEGILNPHSRNYRTNFWTAKPDPYDSSSFFVSQRGAERSENANNVIKVTFTGDVATAAPAADGTCANGGRNVGDACVPLTSDTFTFERVYGFNGEIESRHYPGDFAVETVAGQPLLVVNHFRDLSYWKSDDRYFSLAAKVLDQAVLKSTETPPATHAQSYYQVALNSRGRAVSCSFYGNSVLLLDVVPGAAITVADQIY